MELCGGDALRDGALIGNGAMADRLIDAIDAITIVDAPPTDPLTD
jgi:hypothetical protein